MSLPSSINSTELKNKHRQAILALVEKFNADKPSVQNINTLLKQISDTTDHTLTHLWQAKDMPEQVALVAVGGYGRAELFPYSDVDVLILLPNELILEENEAARQAIEAFIARSWDLGLHIGSSVRTLTQCLQVSAKDITIQTALLESRLITGNPVLYQQFQQNYFEQMNVPEFTQGKLSEMRRRHQKYDNSPYTLEPNCKESPGGLRDLHVVLWITKAARLGNNWSELTQNGLLTKLEERQVRHNEAWLKLVRAHLHLHAKRHEDRLRFDVQEQIAQTLHYQPAGPRRASEVFMRRYYRTAKNISQINHVFISSITEHVLSQHSHNQAPPSRPIDAHFVDRAGMLDIVNNDIYTLDPHQILRTFLVYAQQPNIKTFSTRTFRALYNAHKLMNADFRKDPINAQTFINILKAPQGISQTFSLMNQTSVLGRYLWVFRGIVGQMQHDLFHVYTVDQHTLMVLRNIHRFFIPEHAHEYPLCSEIAAEFDKPWLLYIAALFHDIAKGRQGDHSVLGARDVAQFSQHHGLNADESELVEFLVTQHLTLSHVAQKEDIGDPQVIHNFIDVVKDERHLNALYLLTVADIRGTSPKVWNSWKAHLLEQLYQLTLHIMGGHIPEPAALANTRKRAALDDLVQMGFVQGHEQALWSTLNASYFMRHESQSIAWHTQMLWDKVASSTPTVRVKINEGHDGLQVLVYTPDRPDLFARICGFFSMTDLSIVDARIHTTIPSKNTTGWALDTFQLIPAAHSEEGMDEAVDAKRLEKIITHDLQKILQDDLPLPVLRPSRLISRRARSFPLPPTVELQPDENRQRWLLNITAGDRVGLLYTVARILAEKKINVELAKISTLGDRVEDTFLISSPQLEQPLFQEELEKNLFEAIKV